MESGTVYASTYESPIGPLYVAVTQDGVVRVGLPYEASGENGSGRTSTNGAARWVWEDPPEHSAPAVDALRRYFEGDGDAFRGLPLAPHGTPFQMAIWQSCAEIPFGKTVTYGDLAAKAGRPGAARAVGGAMNRNPLPLIVPCHRVVGSGGDLTGYGMGGLGVKRWLLEHEGRNGD
ncbi:MAG: methylated-DNA--[protein]-cysteine S-methyltransferase [Euryarchaeota archaeon]|nr:methylated-DNA--[protein]-cysteine S-methyltransferase [Euryarchaeota archaeon]